MDQKWEEVNPGTFNIYCFKHKIYKSRIWIKADSFKKGLTRTLEESANRWIKMMANKYNWKNVETTADGWAKIDGQESYWKTFQYYSKNMDCYEKIYRVSPGI